jgi:hypothetical protein
LPAGLSATTLRTRLHRGLGRLRELTRGLLALVPPLRLGHWLTMAANPAAVGLLLLAQQTPAALPPPPPSAPQVRPLVHRAAAAPVRATAVEVVPSGPPPAPPPPAVRRYDFEDDQVDGDISRPDGVIIDADHKARHPSLIEIPGDFVAAVAKSVEDL